MIISFVDVFVIGFCAEILIFMTDKGHHIFCKFDDCILEVKIFSK